MARTGRSTLFCVGHEQSHPHTFFPCLGCVCLASWSFALLRDRTCRLSADAT